MKRLVLIAMIGIVPPTHGNTIETAKAIPTEDKPSKEYLCRQEEIAKKRAKFDSLPAELRDIDGLHGTPGTYETVPKSLNEEIKKFDLVRKSMPADSILWGGSGKATVQIRTAAGGYKNVEMEKEPRLGRLNIRFAVSRDFRVDGVKGPPVMMFLDYSQPTIPYFFPVEAVRIEGGKIRGRAKGFQFSANDQNIAEKNRYKTRFDVEIEISRVAKDYIFVHWKNNLFNKKNDQQFWKQLIAVAYTNEPDRHQEEIDGPVVEDSESEEHCANLDG